MLSFAAFDQSLSRARMSEFQILSASSGACSTGPWARLVGRRADRTSVALTIHGLLPFFYIKLEHGLLLSDGSPNLPLLETLQVRGSAPWTPPRLTRCVGGFEPAPQLARAQGAQARLRLSQRVVYSGQVGGGGAALRLLWVLVEYAPLRAPHLYVTGRAPGGALGAELAHGQQGPGAVAAVQRAAPHLSGAQGGPGWHLCWAQGGDAQGAGASAGRGQH